MEHDFRVVTQWATGSTDITYHETLEEAEAEIRRLAGEQPEDISQNGLSVTLTPQGASEHSGADIETWLPAEYNLTYGEREMLRAYRRERGEVNQ